MNFKQLAELEPNWDSYGAPRIDQRCIAKAREVYYAIRDDRLQVVPCSDGGVQLEAHYGGLDIEITISPASSGDER